MTTTTILHAVVAREINRIRRVLYDSIDEVNLHLEAHELAEQLQRAVSDLLYSYDARGEAAYGHIGRDLAAIHEKKHPAPDER